VPFAVVREEKTALRLFSLNRAAIEAGLSAGMGLTDARAIAPDLMTRVHEPEHDRSLLEALHRWAGKFSPWVATHERNALFLDISGCAHLFSGEAPMLECMSQELKDLAIDARLGLADTKRAALALAKFGRGKEIAPTGQTRQSVQGFPVEALDVEPSVLTGLRRLGLKTIREVLALPRAQLARRFGTALVHKCDELIGASADPVSPAKPKPILAARMTLPEPIGLLEDVEECVRRLIAQVCKRLSEAQMGARQLRLEIGRADNSHFSETIGLARPTRDAKLIYGQFERPLSKIDAGYGIERVRLSASIAEPFIPEQLNTAAKSHEAHALDEVLSRIGNRIGFEQIGKYHTNESHVPERSFFLAPVNRNKPEKNSAIKPNRPLVQFQPEPANVIKPGRPPRSFQWRRKHYALASANGPERILPEWWQDVPGWQGGGRDYWFVQTREGERLWLYNHPGNERRQDWFVAGIFP